MLVELKESTLSSVAPAMPNRLPGMVKHAISQVPDYMQAAAAQGLFPPCAAQMSDIRFCYSDNTIREFTFSEGTVAESGLGKSCVDVVNEHISRSLTFLYAERMFNFIWRQITMSLASDYTIS